MTKILEINCADCKELIHKATVFVDEDKPIYASVHAGHLCKQEESKNA